mgnify:CR=1 FL=1
MTIRALAFDLDGTLCHTLPDLIAAANASRAHMGLPPLPEATIESYIGDGIPRLVHRVLTNRRDGDADAPPAEHAEAYRYFTAYYLDHLSDKTRPYPQVPETLTALQQRGLKLAVVTNKNEAPARRLLADLHIAEHFALIYGGDSLPEKKPAPLPLITATEALGVAPAHMLMVGDSANDILAAKAAGCPVAAVTFGYADTRALYETPATRADYLIDRFTQLLGLV